jgi:hypothetical protein
MTKSYGAISLPVRVGTWTFRRSATSNEDHEIKVSELLLVRRRREAWACNGKIVGSGEQERLSVRAKRQHTQLMLTEHQALILQLKSRATSKWRV